MFGITLLENVVPYDDTSPFEDTFRILLLKVSATKTFPL